MNDYSKWDKIADSDEEDSKQKEKLRQFHEDSQNLFRREQERLEKWLRRQETEMQHIDEDALALPAEL
eukprot:CAMPEP_0198508224 /NCGR_PEP_ID=MMETSP1462-20131121/12823_1 /TAXON_ID=1333877 /ORGANISM="Brandtodinium nutriculum, Strain RCC3387" /LENGTH=67 /DNA_ID=CAMNT_0044237495 /DNA_START=49 /DNA_END=249 /DNA_ORIENTATION=-